MTSALVVRDLSKQYRDFRLDSVSFSLPTGGIMGFVGQNGAGKTTTIRLILNMAVRDSGHIAVCGLDNQHDELAVKQQTGVVFDEIFFPEGWRVKEVERGIRGFYPGWDTELFQDFLKAFDLDPGKRVRDLSRGMKMKLMLAAAMSHGAKLLVLDEPTSGLDPVARDELLSILATYIADGERSVFFSTHITTDLERIATHLTLIEQGRIFYTGTKAGLEDHFRLVRGNREDLTEPIRQAVIGLTQDSFSFTGLLPAADAPALPPAVTSVTPAIDDVLIYISKQGARHE